MNRKKTKVAFLDRDGVLNVSAIKNGYIGFVKDFKWVSGAKRAIKLIKKNDYKVVIVTNQSGIARGYFSLRDVYKLHRFLRNELIEYGTSIDKIYFCPYHKDGIVKKYKKNSTLRKPKIGMFLKACKVWNIDKQKSFMIGDQKTDMEFAKKSKIKGYLFKEKNLFNFIKDNIIFNK